ncbi:MAG: Smr/MutS family protein, partial [Thermodesulfobacteriota bacterium]|nr:Smr/MutS family protein [Thermodesulfobacteriota bacterium]
MREKRKKKRLSKQKNKFEKKKEFINKPFDGVLINSKASLSTEEPVLDDDSTSISKEDKEEYLFQEAMKGVVPLRDNNKKKIIKPPSQKEDAHILTPDSRHKTKEYFKSLINEPEAWDISFSDEYMEGATSGIGPRAMKKLKRGEFSVQDYIDLHGLTKVEAEEVVNNFIVKSHNKGMRCVLIIHGRGLGSVDNQPAIKKELPTWFKRGALKKIVLAFV